MNLSDMDTRSLTSMDFAGLIIPIIAKIFVPAAKNPGAGRSLFGRYLINLLPVDVSDVNNRWYDGRSKYLYRLPCRRSNTIRGNSTRLSGCCESPPSLLASSLSGLCSLPSA